ncbi:MAG: slipin family protein [Nanoarchaeota archaeon]|nr:slipin family protein [Nanoarchaeota archaeon]MBU1005020.1 slipin family protein [Nanoarchaeota archaeon]MBU1945912.1 slipin family protein [Nanoarchaeota archaeon]
MVFFGFGLTGFFLFWICVLILMSLKVVKQYEKGVKFTLGKFAGMIGPGLRVVIPIIQTWERVDLRIKTIDVPSQECVSRDNVSLKVNAVLYYKVSEANRAIIEVEEFNYAVSQLAQTTMRNIVGEFELDDILQKREVISHKIQSIVDKDTDPWGIKVSKIEIKDIELPETMKRAMAHQAEAERDRRARITLALGEAQAAEKLAEAAKIIGKEPAGLQLRLFQTMSEVASEKNSTIILPVPVELINFITKSTKK